MRPAVKSSHAPAAPPTGEMTKDSRPAPRLAYMPGVDGLRAVAVSAVLVYHLGASWLPGGFLGVDIFLVRGDKVAEKVSYVKG